MLFRTETYAFLVTTCIASSKRGKGSCIHPIDLYLCRGRQSIRKAGCSQCACLSACIERGPSNAVERKLAASLSLSLPPRDHRTLSSVCPPRNGFPRRRVRFGREEWACPAHCSRTDGRLGGRAYVMRRRPMGARGEIFAPNNPLICSGLLTREGRGTCTGARGRMLAHGRGKDLGEIYLCLLWRYITLKSKRL